MPDYRAESCKIDNLTNVQRAWLDLQQRADCSYFQSWGWIGTWLEQVANELTPALVKIWHGELLVGMGVFVPGQITRHRIFHVNAMFLNEYPFNGHNMVIEYNGLLADKNHQQAVYRETLRHILTSFDRCDEFFFSAVYSDEVANLIQQTPDDSPCQVKLIEKSQTWSVALNQFEHGIDGFVKTLGKNRRAQVARSIREYQEQGPLEIHEANSMQQALQFFDGLKRLHTERWQLKGGNGSFANPLWEKFHRSLITSRFDHGEIQLLQVRNQTTVIGYLYNFIWRRRIYVLQTGFQMSGNNRLMPGYVSHVLAIAHNKQKGMDIYDLMHGDSLYKRLLCNHSQTLYWLVIQRTRLKFLVEDSCRALVRKLKGNN